MSTKLTHCQKWTVIASLQQCFAIKLLIESRKSFNSFDYDDYYKRVLHFVGDLERTYSKLDEINEQNLEKCSKSTQESFKIYLNQKMQFLEAKDKQLLNYKSFDEYENDDNSNSQARSTNNGSDEHYSKHETNSNQRYSILLRKLLKLVIKCRKGVRVSSEYLYKQGTVYLVISIANTVISGTVKNI